MSAAEVMQQYVEAASSGAWSEPSGSLPRICSPTFPGVRSTLAFPGIAPLWGRDPGFQPFRVEYVTKSRSSPRNQLRHFIP